MEIIASLIGFLLFCLLLLALPVELGFSFEKNDSTADYRTRLYWLFGLISVDLSRKERKAEKSPSTKKPKKKKKPRLESLIGSEKSVKSVLRLIRNLLQSVHIKELKLHGRIGLGDPAYTGMLFGVLHPFLLTSRNITLTADYHEAVFKGYGIVRLRLYPIQVLGCLLAFVFSKRS
jgi:hypothetical protein